MPLTHKQFLILAALFVSSADSIIFGNSTTSPVPYQVSLQEKCLWLWRHVCGGVILSSSYIVTAAHCFSHVCKYRVVAGTNSLKGGGSHHKVISFKIHPDYYELTGNESDIAVAKVFPKFQLDGVTIGKIGFQNQSTILEDTACIATGWGLLKGYKPIILQEATFRTLSNERCREKAFPALTSSELCALGDQRSETSAGDSGGPLVNEDRTMLLGIVIYGRPRIKECVFTRVSFFEDWIKGEIDFD